VSKEKGKLEQAAVSTPLSPKPFSPERFERFNESRQNYIDKNFDMTMIKSFPNAPLSKTIYRQKVTQKKADRRILHTSRKIQ